ncbi:MAG: hypothetical protein HYR66_08865 [Sphingobacteriales bacterium]|nr:hypothetical protein [Sphingobacteriales bacterium]MBI3720801.1 hypothetical protein [Sphingobacteriales bacterium]
MKPVVVALLLLIAAPVFAQDTTKVEQYCGLILRPRAFSNKVNIELDFGEGRRSFADNRMRDEMTGKLKTFNSVVDAMNYMGQQGWVLVNAFPSEHNGTNIYFEFFFKKTFKKEDIHEDK